MIVMKFGGESLTDAAAIRQAVQRIKENLPRKPVVVVSALAGVTDLLVELCKEPQSYAEFFHRADYIFGQMLRRHEQVCVDLFGNDHFEFPPPFEKLRMARPTFEEFHRTIFSAIDAGSPCGLRDLILSYGERLSAKIVFGVCDSEGIAVRGLDPPIIIADYEPEAIVLMRQTREACANIKAEVDRGRVPIIPGFIARTPTGRLRTLGRGGSDLSATVIAAAIDAEEVILCETVDGVMTADPREFPEAGVLPLISYDEAAELSCSGAKILHPRAIGPVKDAGIPVRVKHTFYPECPGTLISDKSVHSEGGVKAVSMKRGLTMVSVSGTGMPDRTGFLERVAGAARKAQVSIVSISQPGSQLEISLVVTKDDEDRLVEGLDRALMDEIASGAVAPVKRHGAVALVAAIGDGMCDAHGVSGRVFGAVGRAGISVRGSAQAGSERNISFFVRDEDAVRAVRAVHEEFHLERFGGSDG